MVIGEHRRVRVTFVGGSGGGIARGEVLCIGLMRHRSSQPCASK